MGKLSGQRLHFCFSFFYPQCLVVPGMQYALGQYLLNESGRPREFSGPALPLSS